MNEITSVQLTEVLAILMDIRELLERRTTPQPLLDALHSIRELMEDRTVNPQEKLPEPSVLKGPVSSYSEEDECPRCGADMVERQGPHGSFFGCSAYPECKGTRRIE